MKSQEIPDPREIETRAWFVASQWSAYRGEERVNLIRLIAIAIFFLMHLAHFYELNDRLGLRDEQFGLPANQAVEFHQIVSMIALAWMCLVMAVRTCLNGKFFPPILPYLVTSFDALLLSMLLYATRGPSSALTSGYFLIIAMAVLRFKLSLVWCATLACILGYSGLFMTPWIGSPVLKFQAFPIYQRALFITAMAVMGMIEGQIIRQARAMANDYKYFLQLKLNSEKDQASVS